MCKAASQSTTPEILVKVSFPAIGLFGQNRFYVADRTSAPEKPFPA
jgi:hypothetical protein